MGTKICADKLIAWICIILIALVQVLFVMPADVHSAAGQELEIRVQYEGEPGGKIRTKAVFSNADLEAMGAHDKKYVNITRVGTLMKTAAHCVDIDDIISTAGIDLGSVKSFTFRTRDGYTMTFSGSDYLNAAGWYYPNLGNHSNSVDIGEGALQMEAGALDGASHDSYPALAIKSHSVKGFTKEPSFSSMTTSNSYRFLTGQTDLSYLKYTDEEGNEAYSPTEESDVTAWDSVKYIYGIDVVLKGSPSINGIKLGIDGKGIKVGSSKQISITFDGAFAEMDATDAEWSSSDESIATVDGNGVVTIKKKGTVTITASGYGHTASITINGTAASKSQTKEINNTSKDNKQKQKTRNTEKVIIAKEISIGDEVTPEPEESAAVYVDDTQELGEVESYDKGTVAASAAVALAACGSGAVFRVRRFRSDLGMNLKGKK